MLTTRLHGKCTDLLFRANPCYPCKKEFLILTTGFTELHGKCTDLLFRVNPCYPW